MDRLIHKTRNIQHIISDISSYDRYVVFLSGGKDSIAIVLTLLENGIPKEKIELHHHSIDGKEGSTLMDWPITEDYCRAVAEALDMPLYFSWREGGFEAELLREESPTGAVLFESADGTIQKSGGNSNKLGTRLRFPQQAADLRTRYCSAVLKIDVADAWLRKEIRFVDGRRYLVFSGERAEESSARQKYKKYERHRTYADKRKTRYVYHGRPVHGWVEGEIWAIMQRWGIVPHPAYRIGFARTSCMACIFGSANQWATIREGAGEYFNTIASYEKMFSDRQVIREGRPYTLHRSGKTLNQLADEGSVYDSEPGALALGLSKTYNDDIVVSPSAWQLPPGAFGENCGPT